MFKWPGVPSARADVHELADFAELNAWRDGSVSVTALSQALGRLEENDYTDGVPEENETDNDVEEAFVEAERRQKSCRNGYPFVVEHQGYTLIPNSNTPYKKVIIYKYLLLATRLDMSSNRIHAGIDGALLLEELAALVALEYFGHRSESLVFGTASNVSSFSKRVDYLCGRIGEGAGFENRNAATPNEKDGKLDVVAWKSFADSLPGKLIAFGQCKTGTSYKDTLNQLQPDSFCRKWLRSPLVLNPLRMFFVSEALPESHWYNTSVDAGLLFDRCRMVDFCDNASSEVIGKAEVWTEAAAKATELPSLEDLGNSTMQGYDEVGAG